MRILSSTDSKFLWLNKQKEMLTYIIIISYYIYLFVVSIMYNFALYNYL